MRHHVRARFPEHAETIEALGVTNAAFEALCHRYGHVVEQLRELASSPGGTTSEDTAELKKRRAALEEELLLTINSNRP